MVSGTTGHARPASRLPANVDRTVRQRSASDDKRGAVGAAATPCRSGATAELSMSDGNKKAGPELAPAWPGPRPSITSRAELAAHLGRELSISAVDANGWTNLHYAAALDWPATARALLAAGAPWDARLRADREPLSPRLLGVLSECGQDRFRLLRRHGATPLHIAAVADACEAVGVLIPGPWRGRPAAARRTGGTSRRPVSRSWCGKPASTASGHPRDVAITFFGLAPVLRNKSLDPSSGTILLCLHRGHGATAWTGSSAEGAAAG